MPPPPGAGWLAALLLLCALPLQAQTPLPTEITRVLSAHKIPQDAVSLVVQAVDEDQPRLELNPVTPRNPASTIKLVTSWAALDVLGPTHTWATRVYALGPLKDGVLEGDLLIRGGGDPYLTLDQFWRMLGELRDAGVRDIRGDLVLDNTLYDVTDTDPGAFDGEPFRLYNVLPDALLVNFKSIDFVIETDAAGKAAEIRTLPELPNLRVTSRIKLNGKACRGTAPRIIMQFAQPGLSDHVLFTGDFPSTCRRYRIGRTAMDHGAYTYGVFKTLWAQWGGTIAGGHRYDTLDRKRRPLLTWRSQHLAEIIRPLNKWSNNVMTRMLLFAIAESRHQPPVTRQQGAALLTTHLQSRGLDTTGLHVDNGSGLSRDTRVTARLLTELLRVAWHEPHMPEFVASLSIGGRDGTTRKRFRRSKAKGRMHVKTGSLKNVSAVAGYVHTRSGRTFAVSALVNWRGANFGIGRDVQDAVLNWAFKQN